MSSTTTNPSPQCALDAEPALIKRELLCRQLSIPEPTLQLSQAPGPYSIPQELFAFTPQKQHIFAYFFKGTTREVVVRQIFFHTPLTQQEKKWLREIRVFLARRNYSLPSSLEPFLLRVCYFNWRKYGEKLYLIKSYEHLLDILQWRAKRFPISDTDAEVSEDLNRGIMYWAARDKSFQPLLIVRLRRSLRPINPKRLETLCIFCFEWAMRYLFVPGMVESCVVILDVRGVSLHQLPMSALSDLTRLLTRQYPFRLSRMHIIHDSLFIQTTWSLTRKFLSDIQQQKMNFMRHSFAEELLKTFAPHQLEQEFGGTRPQINSFYPFPLPPGPCQTSSESSSSNVLRDCWKAVSDETSRGVFWESDDVIPVQWSSEAKDMFRKCGLVWNEVAQDYANPSTPSDDFPVYSVSTDSQVTGDEARPHRKSEVLDTSNNCGRSVSTSLPLTPPTISSSSSSTVVCSRMDSDVVTIGASNVPILPRKGTMLDCHHASDTSTSASSAGVRLASLLDASEGTIAESMDSVERRTSSALMHSKSCTTSPSCHFRADSEGGFKHSSSRASDDAGSKRRFMSEVLRRRLRSAFSWRCCSATAVNALNARACQSSPYL